MRPPVPRLVWCYLVCLLLALDYCGRCFLVATGIGRDRESEAAFAEYWQGHRCVDAGEYLAAIPHYDVWRDLLRRRGQDDSPRRAANRSGFTKHRRLPPTPAADGYVDELSTESTDSPPSSLLALDRGCSPSPACHL